MTSIRSWTGALTLFLFSFFILTHPAAASCGNIIYLEEVDRNVFQEDVIPIDNCDNPFNVDTEVGYVPNLTLNGETVGSGDIVTIEEDAVVDLQYSIQPSGHGSFYWVDVYQVTEDGYRQIAANAETGDSFQEGLPEGEYVAAYISFTVFGQAQKTPSWLDKLRGFFLPNIAHAFYEDDPEVAIITFTINHEAQEPEGASSVLFLPGIQASRLYTDGVLGSENRLWEPNRNEDVRKLAMTEAGESIEDVYTKDVMDEIFVFGNVYKSFLKLLEALEEDEVIKEFLPFAYDWRYDVFVVATEPVVYPDGEQKLLLEEIKRMAAESYTGKVTIVAHSNGGLVTKALLYEYGDTELADLVDKVVLVGTPQLGTPKAIGSMLHGLKQGTMLGIFLNPGVLRETTVTLPGAYGLLPSAKYFENYATDIITVDNSLLTESVSSYGNLSSYTNFVDFLVDEKTTRNNITNISQPLALNTSIMNQAIAQQQILGNWVAPDGVDVFEVAGTGNPTIDGFHYREFRCPENNKQCIIKPYVKPLLKFTTKGDETVVLSSATAYAGDKVKYVVNLNLESAGLLNKDISHGNLTESESVQVFIESLIKYPYVTDEIIITRFSELTQPYRIVGVHSPVSIIVTDKDGNVTGRNGDEVKEEVGGSSYIEFAGSKYVIVPGDAEVEVVLTGEAVGRYSLTIEELSASGEQVLVQEILGATSTVGMVVTFGCDEVECSEAAVDYDADGESDATFDWSGNYGSLNVPEVVPEEAVEKRSSSKSSATRIREASSPVGLVAGISTEDQDLAEMWAVLLQLKEALDALEVYYNLKN